MEKTEAVEKAQRASVDAAGIAGLLMCINSALENPDDCPADKYIANALFYLFHGMEKIEHDFDELAGYCISSAPAAVKEG